MVSSLERALAILEREMQKSPASLAQVDTTDARSLLQSRVLSWRLRASPPSTGSGCWPWLGTSRARRPRT